jgi:hypothetical protein
MGDVMYVHCGNQPRIVNLHSGYGMNQNEAPPFQMNPLVVCQKSECGFNQSSAPVRLSNGQTVSILSYRTSADVPELSKILRSEQSPAPA